MQHHFDTSLAHKYGIFGAVLIDHFVFWLAKNKANESNVHDGRVWTYNSRKAFAELFPYVSEKTIRNELEKLIKEKVLMTGNFNQSAYDRTLWYTFTDAFAQSNSWIWQNGQMDLPKMANGNAQNGIPIPYTIPDSIPYTNNVESLSSDKSSTKKSKKKKIDFDYSFVEEQWRDAFYKWIGHKKNIGKGYKTQDSLEVAYEVLKKCSNNNYLLADEVVKQSIGNNWQGLFPLKNNGGQQNCSNNGNAVGSQGGSPDTFKSLERESQRQLAQLMYD